jgi:tetratricopeptide (TPR) repeat protein
VLLAVSCSTENNTFINRNYHGITAKYNGYFNANELLKTALESYQTNNKENFYEVLPIEQFPKEKEFQAFLPAIDTAISKCSKVIRNHCMPSMEFGGGKKVENNPWIDENWNTIGKAFFLKHEYELSQRNYEYVQRLFAKDKSYYIASMWIIKAMIASNKINEAKEKLLELDLLVEKHKKEKEENKTNFLGKITRVFAKKDKKETKLLPEFSKRMEVELALLKGNLYIHTEEYTLAIENLEKAITNSKKKKEKTRIHFILGQLYAITKNNELAKDHFSKVVSSSQAPFEMQFNARINRAFLGKDEKIKKDLQRMLKDEKNTEFRDQLYYALAKLFLQDNNRMEAIVLLHKSTYYSTANKRQQAISYEELGNLSYQIKNYIKAQKYYDSCVKVMPENYPNDEDIRKKAMKLKNLVIAVDIVAREDSVLRIAQMDAKTRKNYLEKVIKNTKSNAEKKQKEEAARLRDIQAKQQAAQENDPSGNKWYWNNVKSKADGISEFKKNWGDRENEDDWRRIDKIVIAANKVDSIKENGNTNNNTTTDKDTLTIENLAAKLPLTKSLQDSSMKRLMAAQYEAGLIYKELLGENKLAVERFVDVLSRNYVSDYKLLSAYQLYKIYEGKDNAKMQAQKTYILKNYPNSDYANYIKDPNFFTKKKEDDRKAEESYVKVLVKYRTKHFEEVINACTEVINSEPKNVFLPKYMLLNAMANASQTNDKKSIEPLLIEIVEKFPGTIEGKKARELIEILQKGVSQNKKVEFNKESIYKFVEGQPLWIIIFLDPNGDSNAAKNKIALFNEDAYAGKEITVSSKLFNENQSMVVLKSFTHTDAEEYIDHFKSDKTNLNEYSNLPIYLISQENLKVLFETHKLEEYKTFYTEYFN